MENWESLDTDDSDLPSLLLRPCTTTINTTNSNHTSQINNNSNSPSSFENPTISLQVSNRRIPGPAGELQAKMDRKKRRLHHDNEREMDRNGKQIEKCYDFEEDRESEEFELGPWLCAIDFVGRLGTHAIPLSSVTKSRDIGRMDLVVAVITSCTPNGLGDVMVTLKDPTGTISASIHRKVFFDGEFGKEIFVGSVLILQKVAVFCPSRSALYLNITQSNVVKVISKDSGPPTMQNTCISASAVRPASGDHRETSVNVEPLDSMEVQMTEELCDDIEQCDNSTGSVNNDKETGKENKANSSSKRDQTNTSADQIHKKVCRKDIMDDEQRGPNASANLDKDLTSEVIMTMPCVQREKQPVPTVIASLPEWTDEQLNELFTADYEDIGPFL